MNRKALLRDGVVVNVIVVADDANWVCPKDCIIMDEVDGADVGASYDESSKAFSPRLAPERRKPRHLLMSEEVEALKNRIAELEAGPQ
jgi:hypothetical protein